ncbi:MAG: hypothetical protein JWR01_2036 [Subtercola sp.]|nr:hypothetical protein [Subtercola sp.]
MSRWNPDTLTSIGTGDDLHISPFRADGTTYGTPTWIWSVVIDNDLYVRAYNGTNGRWYTSAIEQKAGRIRAADATHEVTFEKGDPSVNDAVDAAYLAKYHGSPYLPPMVTTKAQASTVKISPRP